ncbi:MAG: UPF0182 family protein, partial [Actinomycetota bacterium]|nr:UPF0182 family protein [Actinomycetota bacterium]
MSSLNGVLRRRLGLVIAIVAVALVLSATRIAVFLTELWWFESVGYRPIYTEILFSQVGLGFFFGLALAALVGANLAVARRLRPIVVPASPREAVIERYRQLAEPYVSWLILGVALLFAFSAGGAVATQWDSYLLWRHGDTFGVPDPQFQRDVGFYVFDLPWLAFVQGWLFASLVLTLLVTAAAHYLLGSIRPEAPRERVTLPARAHLSLLLALVLAAQGWGYWLDRFELNFSPRGQVTGASYTDIHAELPALNLLLVVTAVAILLVLVNIRRRGWLLPGVAIALLVFFSVILQGIYPEVIQRLRVDPQELPREQRFIERNLAATRAAYGIDAVEGTRFSVQNDLAPPDVQENEVTLKNVRLWDPDVLETTYKQLQAIRPYYDFEDVDVDRYLVDGELRQVMVAARELNIEGLQEQARTWQNTHLTYTHGYGFVSSLVNTASPEGQPVFLVRDIPPQGSESLVPTQPGIYHGEVHEQYSLVRTQEPELDFEVDGVQQSTEYAGEDGVPIGSMLRRLGFALRFADPNLVLSGLIDGDSRILLHRTVQDRVRQVAPFLHFDADPYPVVLDGRMVWIADAYTTSAFYPYSERRRFGTEGPFVNYVRNSVKAVVDAYDGSVTLFVVDPEDPVLQAWQRAFPE